MENFYLDVYAIVLALFTYDALKYVISTMWDYIAERIIKEWGLDENVN
ncbi:MAG: hypothetical protein IJX36_08640 [Thermoguttaceae bacterium]|nr:hypothetical protein [Thermoguttaceae bacterium]MBQ8363977.1 hypothetical protein [Thermoguttaceae bacterium]MBQ9127937.1 hypothetical protein [Thermoguttaceae bacterium]